MSVRVVNLCRLLIACIFVASLILFIACQMEYISPRIININDIKTNIVGNTINELSEKDLEYTRCYDIIDTNINRSEETSDNSGMSEVQIIDDNILFECAEEIQKIRIDMFSLANEGDYRRALDHLEKIKRLFPRISDRIALLEGNYRMELESDSEACEIYEKAIRSPNRGIAAEARIARVRCLLVTHDSQAHQALFKLLQRYPHVPQELELRYLGARHWEHNGKISEAIKAYQSIDIDHPGSHYASLARERLSELRQAGVQVDTLALQQRIIRAKKLVHSGPMDVAREEVESIMELDLPDSIASYVAGLGARIYSIEGRWQKVQSSLNIARNNLPENDEERNRFAQFEQKIENTIESSNKNVALEKIHRITGNIPLSRHSINKVYPVLEIASSALLTTQVNDAIDVIIKERNIPPGLRFRAAILSSGVGDDERVSQLFSSLREHPFLGLASRYHYARSLERLHRNDEAISEYRSISQEDRSQTPFYGFLARRRLDFLNHNIQEESNSSQNNFDIPSVEDQVEERQSSLENTNPLAENSFQNNFECLREQPLSSVELAEMLRPLAESRGDEFPWFSRAMDLLLLGAVDKASEELYEAFLVHSEARGQKPRRSGLVSILLGRAPPRRPMSPELRRARRVLSNSERRLLADLGEAMGDHGIEMRFGGWARIGERPRAYEDIVQCAARRYGVDPALLFAVMRVESVYDSQVVSNAGAIGLMQIMPRTGTLIADSLGMKTFTTDVLLEPEVNINFAAWYLSTLIERFNGRVPLAIAAYNGGPHNVRLWLEQYSDSMPIDAFLETIPFAQTHRYVRRVLTHYESYRVQQNLTVPVFDLTRPRLQPDEVAF